MDNKDPYGIANVNFTLIDPSDSRWEEYKQQRFERGFDNSELWNLDSTIAKFIAPRIKEFVKYAGGVPGRIYFKYENQENGDILAQEEWDNILEEIVWTFENYNNEPNGGYTDDWNKRYEEYTKRIANGLKLFAEWFGSLSY